MIINSVSFAIYLLLLYGRSLATINLNKHIRWMIAVIALDTSLILFLVFFRNALSKVNLSMSPLLIIHIIFALSTVVAYVLTLYWGFKIRSGLRQPGLMRRLDRIIVTLRALTLLTSIAVSWFV
ncbi:MAG: hypothetical protein K1X29_10120 [Bdellovibrionales bacterium]|nr:hypothetical protein [Bdellovibrionales bacterium]